MSIRDIAFALIFTTALASGTHAQTSARTELSPALSAQISLEKTHWTVGGKPIAKLLISNLTDHTIDFSCDHFYVHMDRFGFGEPPRTSWWSLPTTLCAAWALAPHEKAIHTYDLSVFYDLTAPGTYRVWIDEHNYNGAEQTTSDVAQFDIATIGDKPLTPN